MKLGFPLNSRFREIELGRIKPLGWLRKQLELQMEGLTGHLDEIWPYVGPESAWLGGSGDDWERGPYYCDGLVSLAYLVNESWLIKKAEKWINSVLSSQTPEGSFGPRSNLDWWPRMVMLKALTSYHEATKDQRVMGFLRNYFKYQLVELPSRRLSDWAWARGFENLVSIFWFHERTKEPFLLDLAKLIISQSIDWSKLFENFPYKEPAEKYLPKEFMEKLKSYRGWPKIFEDPSKVGLTKEEVERFFFIYHTTHVVNVAMALKEPALRYQLEGDERYRRIALKALEEIMRHHGQPNGIFSGDEHLNGRRTTQGTELCAVVEFMFSMENLFKTFGEVIFADYLEKVAYNALPATIRPNFYAHQYDQQVNQVLCNIAQRNWYNNDEDSNIFGLEPNFGCCTANMHQGWPKFTRTLWMKDENDCFVTVAYAPCAMRYDFNAQERVEIVEETDYPFEDEVGFFVSSDRDICIMLRVPHRSKSVTVFVNGEEQEYRNQDFIVLNVPRGKNRLTVRFQFDVEIVSWSNHTVYLQRGPLVFSLPIEEEWRKIRGTEPFADYEVYPKSDWNYGLILSDDISVSRNSVPKDASPFYSNVVPVKLHVKGFKVPNWTTLDGSAADPPKVNQRDVKDSKIVGLELVPYGCTTLRITEFPFIKKDGGDGNV
ncbi:MAG TPA: glycoside hydrolase family 127 protein [Pseudothermotoga sp.]|nr:glycoside hydrolase family 127 protein [Pseudothermotoga sp.]